MAIALVTYRTWSGVLVKLVNGSKDKSKASMLILVLHDFYGTKIMYLSEKGVVIITKCKTLFVIINILQ